MAARCVIDADHGRDRTRTWHGGLCVELLADGAATEGRLALLDVRGERGAGAPCHVHRREDQALLVLEGRLEVTCDGVHSTVGSNGFVFLPRGAPHAFAVVSARARFLCLYTPAGAEAVVRDTGRPTMDGVPVGPGLDPDDLAALLAAAGVHLVPEARPLTAAAEAQ